MHKLQYCMQEMVGVRVAVSCPSAIKPCRLLGQPSLEFPRNNETMEASSCKLMVITACKGNIEEQWDVLISKFILTS